MTFVENAFGSIGKCLKLILTKIILIVIPEEKKLYSLFKLENHELLSLLSKSKFNTRDCHAIFNYNNNAVKSLVHAFKYKNNIRAKQVMALAIQDEVTELAFHILSFYGKNPILIPIPMSKKEEAERGFNPIVGLCKEVEKASHIKTELTCLKKIRETQKQRGLNRTNRLENVSGAMIAQNIGHEYAIVIDDVYTTGSTFREASRALSKAGFKKIYGVFIAH